MRLTPDDIRNGYGLAENLLTMATGGIAEPVSGLAALVAAAQGYDAGGARDAIRGAMTFQPKSAQGVLQQRALSRLAQGVVDSAPVRTWQRGVDIAGRYSPTAGAALQTIPTAIGAAYGAKPAMQQGRAASMLAERMQERMVKNAMAPKVLHPQSGVIMFRGGNPKGESITWYASEKKLADDYARYKGGDVHEADIKVMRPFDAGRTTNEITPREFAIRALSQAGYNDKSSIDLIKKFSNDFGSAKLRVTDFWADPNSAARTRDFLRNAGFDSIKIDEDGVMTTAVFNESEPF